MFADLFKRTHSDMAPDGADPAQRVVADNPGEAEKTMMETTEREGGWELDTEVTSIGEGTTIQGELDVKGQLNIYGAIEGRVRCDSEVYIGESGRVNGDILAMNIKVAGFLEGALECGELTILGNGKVVGEAATDTFVISEGGQFEGNSRRRTADNVTQLMRGAKRNHSQASKAE